MDPKSQNVLELPKVLERLARFAAFSASRDLALSLTPVANPAEVRRRLAETSEARLVLALKPELTVGAAHDVRPQAAAASIGSVLEPEDLLQVKSTLVAARNLARFLEKRQSDSPVLFELSRGLVPPEGLIEAISRVLDDHGEVLDRASDELAVIRRELIGARDRLMNRLQRLLNDPAVTPLLQEALITQRDGRYVLPLRAEFKGKLKAVVHDQSSSGATLFVEPLDVVELNNRVRELELAERDEIRRILAELSAMVGDQQDLLVACVQGLARLDLALAKARYADSIDAQAPILHPPSGDQRLSGTLRLARARHPLLDPQHVVPIDLEMAPATRGLVITGPNTGGKTVALKTAGLMALMAQSGLHLPTASGTELPLFDSVYADIGDEQSIEQSLSTFSAHITNIIRILGQAGGRDLVLLDELGAGTDPQEGSALARALLEIFLARAGVILVATHYPELKAFAHTTPGLQNASVEFDLETLTPTYRLEVGLPGRSNALAIAQRLGLPDDVVQAARQMLAPGELEADALLEEIHKEHQAAQGALARARAAERQAEQEQADLAERLSSIEAERQTLLGAAREDARGLIEEVKQELEGVKKSLRQAALPLEDMGQAEEALAQAEDLAAEPETSEPLERVPDGWELKAGDAVRLRSLGLDGVILDLGDTEAEVQVGRLRIRAQVEDLMPAGAPGRRESVRTPGRSSGPAPVSAAPPLELDLRGLTGDEALTELDRRLDSAYLAGLPFVRVIHGKGSGRLREVVRRALRGNEYVRDFEPGGPAEGGEGVTVVRLALDGPGR